MLYERMLMKELVVLILKLLLNRCALMAACAVFRFELTLTADIRTRRDVIDVCLAVC